MRESEQPGKLTILDWALVNLYYNFFEQWYIILRINFYFKEATCIFVCTSNILYFILVHIRHVENKDLVCNKSLDKEKRISCRVPGVCNQMKTSGPAIDLLAHVTYADPLHKSSKFRYVKYVKKEKYRKFKFYNKQNYLKFLLVL